MTHFQDAVDAFMQACFGAAISADRPERSHRFVEESLELGQALGCTREAAHQLVDYVFSRPVGEPRQEVGGVMVTLAALCNANSVDEGGGRIALDLDIETCGEEELARCWTIIDRIREKRLTKPKLGPLPGGLLHCDGCAPERACWGGAHFCQKGVKGR